MPAVCMIASLLTPGLEREGRLKLSLDELLSDLLAKSWLDPKRLGLPGPGMILRFRRLCLFLISVVSSLILMNSGRESFCSYLLFSCSTSCVIENDPRRFCRALILGLSSQLWGLFLVWPLRSQMRS